MSNKRTSSVADGERSSRRITRQRMADIERGEDHDGVYCVGCPSEDDANLIGYDQEYAEMRPCKHAICLECLLFLLGSQGPNKFACPSCTALVTGHQYFESRICSKTAVDYPSQQEHQDENIRFLHSPYHSFVGKYRSIIENTTETLIVDASKKVHLSNCIKTLLLPESRK